MSYEPVHPEAKRLRDLMLEHGDLVEFPVHNGADPTTDVRYIVGDGGWPRMELHTRRYGLADPVEERIARRVVELLREERERDEIMAEYRRLTGAR